MEEYDHERCSVIYYCASAGDDVHELYHNKSPPTAASGGQHENAALDGVYRNVRVLLDEDQGGFHEGEIRRHGRHRRDNHVLITPQSS